MLALKTDTTAVCEAILRFNAGRDKQRLQMKYALLRKSAFGFFRGTCHLFYDRLPHDPFLAESPLVWCCGDLHLENFGSYKGDNRLAYFDINDFDESSLAPLGWDVLRLLTSLFVALPELEIQTSDAQILAAELLDSYALTLASGKPRWVEAETASGMIKQLLDEVKTRQRVDFLDTRTTKKNKKARALKVDGRKALPASQAERDMVMDFMESYAKTQEQPAFYEAVDVARRVAGNGSLGLERYLVLVRGKGGEDGHYLLDMKVAVAASMVKNFQRFQLHPAAWPSDAERIVQLQQRLQSVPMAFFRAVNMDGRDFVLRALQASEDRIRLAPLNHSLPELIALVRTLGVLSASAHLRASGRGGSAIVDELVAFGGRSNWQASVIALARHCAVQTEADWRAFCAGFDQGVFAQN
jgi:uncharacterized protein (DUF2252 family)